MILFPAIDLRGGRCVRLERGEAERQTTYSDDPVQVAHSFAEAGAEWVHVVDLDAAFGTGSNRALIRELAAAVPLRVQTGGGLRSERELDAVLESGAARAVVGTAAVENPELVRRAVDRWGPERIAVGIDARGTRPAVRGWTEDAAADLFQLAADLVQCGVRTIIYTDIQRDGMLAGPNLAASAELADRSGAEVIVSAGVASLADVDALLAAAAAGHRLGGAIIGKALYEGRVNLRDAVQRVSAAAPF